MEAVTTDIFVGLFLKVILMCFEAVCVHFHLFIHVMFAV